MEQVKKKYEQMMQAVNTLECAIDNLKNIGRIRIEPGYLIDIEDSLRDSVVKRFEYCTDLLWKYVKTYLEEIQSVILETSTPREIFRTALRVEILTEGEVEQVLEMIKMRNHTSHIYKQEIADFVAKKAPEFYALMRVILQKTKP